MSVCVLSEAGQSSGFFKGLPLCLYHAWFAYLAPLQWTFHISHKSPVNLKPAARPFNNFTFVLKILFIFATMDC